MESFSPVYNNIFYYFNSDQKLEAKNIKVDEISQFINYLETNINFIPKEDAPQLVIFCKKINQLPQGINFKNRCDEIICKIESQFKTIVKESPEQIAFEFSKLLKKRHFLTEEVSSKRIKFSLPPAEKILLEQVIQKLEMFSEKTQELTLLLKTELNNNAIDWREIQNSGGSTILHYLDAVEDTQLIKEILKGVKNIDQPNIFGETALMVACKNRSHTVMNLLIQAGSNVDAYDNAGITPLITAIYGKDKKSVEILLSNKADINKPALKHNHIPLFYALSTQNFELADYLIERGANLNHISNGTGITALNFIPSPFLSFRETEQHLGAFINKGVNQKNTENIASRKMLGHIWGIGSGLSFLVENSWVNYEGTYPYIASQKLNNHFLDYLPLLKQKFPSYFSTEIEKKLTLSLQQISLNSNLKESTALEIIQKSQLFPQILVTGWEGHTTAIIIYQNPKTEHYHLIKCNRGEEKEGYGLKMYTINSPLTPEIINQIRTPQNKEFFLKEIDDLLSLKLYGVEELKDQTVGNCTWASLKVAFLGVLILLNSEIDESKEGVDIIKQIYKAYTSFTREEELKTYLKRVQNYPDELDWLLLSRIRIKLNQKLSSNLSKDQEENFRQALKHFDDYLTSEQLVVTHKNKQAILHYFIATNNREGIINCLRLQASIFTSEGGTTGVETASKTPDLELVNFLIFQDLLFNSSCSELEDPNLVFEKLLDDSQTEEALFDEISKFENLSPAESGFLDPFSTEFGLNQTWQDLPNPEEESNSAVSFW